MEWIESAEEILEGGKWWFFPVFLIAGLLIINLVLRVVLSFLWKRDKPEVKVWRSAIFNAISSPLRTSIWLLGVIIAIRHYFPPGHGYPVLDKVNPVAQEVLFVFLIGWFLFSLINRVEENYFKRASVQGAYVDRTVASAVKKLATIIAFLIVALGVFQALGLSIAGLLAFGGTAGIAVGFAAQNLVSNFFGGLTIFASRIFKLGDDIILKSSGLSGTVVHIGWRSTTIAGWDGKRIYVPNSIFNTENLINHSRLAHRTLSQDVLLSYGDYDKIKEVVAQGNDFLATRDDLDYFVFDFSEFGDKALKLNIYAWVRSTGGNSFVPYADFAKAQGEILMGIADIARTKGCKILPQNHVLLKNDPTYDADIQMNH
ncbi:MAG: mechanosensitive ion channel family protein [Oceanisphaera sp.]